MSTQGFWQNKLSAFLHDSPTKALDISSHEVRAAAAKARAGITDADFDKNADWSAAAADRVPFPYYRTSQLSCAFDGVANQFRHPLGGGTLPLRQLFASAAQAEEVEQNTQPVADDARANFFAHWRLWFDHATRKDARLAFLPADTRLPDHTIWNHTAVTAAFAACDGRPALLRFQLGPVQEFIAAARTTRDLWSGSFLIAWLMVSGLKKLSELAGPDAVIFPNLCGQPLFDLYWRRELWRQVRAADGARNAWESFDHSTDALTTPNLPNVFLALVPADRGAEFARKVEAAVREEWKRIADAVWQFAIKPDAPAQVHCQRFNRQITRHLAVAWQVTPFPATLDAAEQLAVQLPDKNLLERFKIFRDAFEKQMPVEHRDRRYYTDETKTKLNNIGAAWPLLVALNAWQLDATRQTRAFAGVSGGWLTVSGARNGKDALTGREEMITGGSKAILDADLNASARDTFKHEGDEVGATTLVKRLWHRAYLCHAEPWRGVFHEKDFSMPNTRSLAQGRPWANDADDDLETAADDDKYFAILAFDGDDMGRWVSGEKLPPLREQLADYTGADGERKGALRYFEEHPGCQPLLENPRPLNPSCHLQFSQSLANFALHAVPRVIAAHCGRLLYAGGDDVLAMLPADRALACADDLQRVFRGLAPNSECGIRAAAPGPGFLCFETFTPANNDRALVFPAVADSANHPIPFLVPGPRATASVGIAVAHFKEPLQDVVRAAQAAEKTAKKLHANKHAFTVSVLKRSGEITHWSARFDNDCAADSDRRRAIAAFEQIVFAVREDLVSAKFPHRLLEFVEPYRAKFGVENAPGFDARMVVLRDLETVADRQRGKKYDRKTIEPLRGAVETYLRNLPAGRVLDDLAGLLTVSAFIARQKESS